MHAIIKLFNKVNKEMQNQQRIAKSTYNYKINKEIRININIYQQN